MEDNERSAVPGKEKRNYVGYEYKEIVADGQQYGRKAGQQWMDSDSAET